MKKKFGRLVDLEELEALMVNETVEELRIRLEGEQRLVDAERTDRRVSQWGYITAGDSGLAGDGGMQ